MEVVRNREELDRFLASQRHDDRSLGFVPTMGALHQGHLSLLDRCIRENDDSIISIYVNPTQFNDEGDLDRYPRDVKADLDLLNRSGVSCVFLPNDQVIYPKGKKLLELNLHGLDKKMEGAFRPGHFTGMVTVVDIFFSLISPDRAYFGEKDFQQLQIVKKLASQRHPKIEIVGCPIDRDENGLARSSRNQLLSSTDYELALSIPRAIKLLKKSDHESFDLIYSQVLKQLKNTKGLELEYLTIADSGTLDSINYGESLHPRAFIAAKVGRVRLIDNAAL